MRTVCQAVMLVWLGTRPSRAWTVYTAAASVTTVAVVALTRLYLGVYWLTDVVGVALLAVSVVMVIATIEPYLRAALDTITQQQGISGGTAHPL